MKSTHNILCVLNKVNSNGRVYVNFEGINVNTINTAIINHLNPKKNGNTQ